MLGLQANALILQGKLYLKPKKKKSLISHLSLNHTLLSLLLYSYG